AAGLQHPNVVGVFDRGEYDGTYYIAMEFLRGRTLKDVIAQEAPLDQARALDIAVQILKAAGFAHRRGIIHRDFKPQNVIVDDEDRVKVTDFGIARAGASEITETGSIMGTAQYLSPEQAQGTAAEETSDLYSIAVLLYEMLTGQLPFTGDSAVAIALRHLTEPPPPLHHWRPDIDPALEAVVLQGLSKDPAQRFPDADAFIAALEHVRPRLGVAAAGPDTAQFTMVNAVPAGDTFIAAGPPYEPYAVAERGPRRTWPWVLLALLLAALVAGGVLFAQERGKVAVPGVVGAPAEKAQALLEQRGFAVNVDRRDSLLPEDQVIQQEPGAGSKAKKGSTVTLTVSGGPPSKVVPSVEGLPLKVAVKSLQNAGFKADIYEKSSDAVRKGLVISTSPAGGTVDRVGDRIRVNVSSGVRRFDVPNVVGLDQGAAESALQDKQLVPVVQQQESDQPSGQVITQDPPVGSTVVKGDRVTITVSKGPGTSDVPDTVGLTAGDARGELEQAGFKVQELERAVDNEADDGLVVDQRPGHGTQLKKGRTVRIWVGKFTPPPTDTTPTGTTPAPTPTTPNGTVTPGAALGTGD
ncbi:MAG: eukaryotic-like serine/threonine-protein kinase, partial [Frankiaceae bacterium]|nr:eukaryotic-like serine/threonine-protein kinase [Frankiaceae bacterium]